MASAPSSEDSFDFGVERIADDRFAAIVPGFGGVTLGAATFAATRTCDGKSLHSIHACFLRPIPPETRVEMSVSRVADGRRFARRRVEIRVGDRLAFELLASFAAAGEGPEFEDPREPPSAPAPEDLESDEVVARKEGWEQDFPRPLEWRWVGEPWRIDSPVDDSRYDGWVRPRSPLPADTGYRSAAIALLSDYHSHWPVARRLGASFFGPDGFTSLDQVVWIHRDLAWDDWWLLSSVADVGHAGRSLGRRTLHTRDGRLVASMAQESLIPGARPLVSQPASDS